MRIGLRYMCLALSGGVLPCGVPVWRESAGTCRPILWNLFWTGRSFPGVITFEEANALLWLDFVAIGNTVSGEEIYVLVQASDVVRAPDVTFVARMAVLFRRVVEARVEDRSGRGRDVP